MFQLNKFFRKYQLRKCIHSVYNINYTTDNDVLYSDDSPERGHGGANLIQTSVRPNFLILLLNNLMDGGCPVVPDTNKFTPLFPNIRSVYMILHPIKNSSRNIERNYLCPE